MGPTGEVQGMGRTDVHSFVRLLARTDGRMEIPPFYRTSDPSGLLPKNGSSSSKFNWEMQSQVCHPENPRWFVIQSFSPFSHPLILILASFCVLKPILSCWSSLSNTFIPHQLTNNFVILIISSSLASSFLQKKCEEHDQTFGPDGHMVAIYTVSICLSHSLSVCLW